MLIMPTESAQFDTFQRDAPASASHRFSDMAATTQLPLAVANESSCGCGDQSASDCGDQSASDCGDQSASDCGDQSASDCGDQSASGFERRFSEVERLSNDELSQQVKRLNQDHQRLDAELLLKLGELEGRKLYRHFACSSLFEFLTARLGQSEDVAYRWMWGARLMRAYPLVYELMAAGRLHLSALMLLKPHLTEENHREWLLAAAGKSKRAVEQLVAARAPRPDVPTRIRRLPQARPNRCGDGAQRPPGETSPSPSVTTSALSKSDEPSPTAVAPQSSPTAVAPQSSPAAVAPQSSPTAVAPQSSPTGFGAWLDKPARATKVQPLSEHSYRVVFTANQRLKDKLDRAGELLSHTLSPTNLPAMVERALDLLIEREERRRYGSPRLRTSAVDHAEPSVTEPPVEPMATAASALGHAEPIMAAHSRHLPARVRRQVWERDGGQCTYIDAQGRRCCSRQRLQFDHRIAHALGGEPSIDNIRLRCSCHNALAAEQVFGVERVAAAIAFTRERRHRPGATVQQT
jgi:5-methylcytosine-specific restriction endonuclease McrA